MSDQLTRYARHRAPSALRRFCPHVRAEALSQIDPEELYDAGVRAVLLDLDNTLLPWKSSVVPADSIAWVERCREAGLKLCLVSNTRNLPRLKAIADKLGIPFVKSRMKPARDGFEKALSLMATSPEQTVMVGDQMFTDVWGGNRMGITTIWVKQMHKREFIGTRFSRVAESLVKRMISRAKAGDA
ncbi:YqeG family HAD IIIA-type phosphatase [Fimbriimonadia bacterium ATM]|nr:MAG: YqeG family HAD IIIA-type phosphatase [Armatimonadota bacterium]MBC6969341.1 YqeG family HAD IIIA-type phosphatase [Armatimonadota bacterium]MCE7899321.1 YqeG family HAD IIIA-type phosphatase [Armatimonadetes bacterium ATM1]MDL1927895.1 YqeG family HAD IIIA-type phosphatase [Fimbriimonadia bacterium ATM]RIJ97377.1 MAG: YqeG family HAD IIIA-type phosphatase [Armatimonadota bacterium]